MVWLAGAFFLVLSITVVALILKIFSQVNERLSAMTQSIQEANQAIGRSLSGTTEIFGNIHERLGQLHQTNLQIYEISKDISSLQELLRAPKFRGQMGETLLEALLAQVLPKEYYRMQYRFKSSEAVDAVIILAEKLVPVDAKFSLENFQKMLSAQDEAEKSSHRKRFIQDVKERIDEIAAKYILPAENTYDFALMYIPAENVYYEVMINEGLFSYGVAKKVFPVSPNTFYAYLEIICLGLKGLEIEENAKDILKHLNTLSIEIGKFKEDFGLLGAHLANAFRKYEDSQKKLDRLSDRMVNIQDTKKCSLNSPI